MEGQCYEIRVRGRLNASLQAAFPQMVPQIEPVETVLVGELEDQAALFGVLMQVQALGLELVEVRHIAAGPGRPEPKPAGRSEAGRSEAGRSED